MAVVATTTESNQEKIPDRIARYRVLEKLGDDALGALYLAEDESAPERGRVRVRVVPKSIHVDPERRARMLADAKAAMAVEHPGLAPLLDVGEDGRELYLVWADAKGRTLRAYVEEKGRVDVAESLRIAEELASAIAAAHRGSVVHGWIDDERVRIDDAGRARVLDLGIAELARHDSELDARSDVYSIAALLHEMISGTRVSANEFASRPPARLPPLEATPGVPAKLATLIENATSAELAKRPADADALLAALSDVDLPTEPVGDQVATSRADARAGSSPAWIVGASIAIAVVLTLAVVLVFAS